MGLSGADTGSGADAGMPAVQGSDTGAGGDTGTAAVVPVLRAALLGGTAVNANTYGGSAQ